MILCLLLTLLHIATASPLLPPSPLFPSFNTTISPWHCNRALSWTKRQSPGGFQVMDCIGAINAFKNDMVKSHDADYQWLAVGASAVPGWGTPVFMPRRYVSGSSSPFSPPSLPSFPNPNPFRNMHPNPRLPPRRRPHPRQTTFHTLGSHRARAG